MADIIFNPDYWTGNKAVAVSGVCNPGVDRTFQYEVKTAGGKVSRTVTVNQEGKREEFSVQEGEGYDPLLLSDGGTFNVVKEKYKGNPDCPVSNEPVIS